MACDACEEYEQLLAEVKVADMDESLRERLVTFLERSYREHVDAAGDASWYG